MTLKQIVAQMLVGRTDLASFDAASREAGVSRDELATLFAREVANGYLHDRYTWQEGDNALNSLNGLFNLNGERLSGLALDVFLAFDEGEYIHDGDEANDGEPRTKSLLSRLHPQLGAE
jgi:hypothetical protein